MPVDNAFYDTEPWRDHRRPLAALGALTPARFGYFRDVLVRTLGVDPAGRRVLDIGCGGGFLAEAFAALGCAVTGVDPSAPSVGQAAAHARRAGLAIAYAVAPGEALPFGGATFDIVCCGDVLEHVDDLDRVIAETARVLKPGGVYFFDTINRTLASRLVVIALFQEWRATRFVATNLHDWRMFIRPRALAATLTAHGLSCRAMTGITPRGNPLRIVRALWQLKRGTITYVEVGARIPMAAGGPTAILYAGYAIQAG